MTLAKDIIQIIVEIIDGSEIIYGLKSDGTVWRRKIAPYNTEWEQI